MKRMTQTTDKDLLMLDAVSDYTNRGMHPPWPLQVAVVEYLRRVGPPMPLQEMLGNTQRREQKPPK